MRPTAFKRTTAQLLAERREGRVIPSLPYFSVIICTYNRRDMVLAVLASLRKQTLSCAKFEVIVIDNGSDDGTYAALQAYLQAGSLPGRRTESLWRIRCVQEPQNGLGYARNTGIKYVKGAVAVFIDDDTFVDPYFLERLLSAYEETEADAIGGCVEIHWEAARPYWLSDDLLPWLGYFSPFKVRQPLHETMSFSNNSFSVKIEALKRVGGFLPFLGKRLKAPMNMEISNLCQRLQRAGYKLWYDPGVVVAHRVSRPRLIQAFLVGRAYWQGRSEVISQYMDVKEYQGIAQRSWIETISIILPEIKNMLRMALLHRPLLFMARKSTNEQIMAALIEAQAWGRLQQNLLFMQHIPAMLGITAVLLVQAQPQEAALLSRGLMGEGVPCVSKGVDIPFYWLWRHRAKRGQTSGIIHCYQPGTFKLKYGQRLGLRFKLWLARRLGLRLVTTDGGGYWQNIQTWQAKKQRRLEREVLLKSHHILAYTRQPELLYAESKIQRKVSSQLHPGLSGILTQRVECKAARGQLGIAEQASFIYLCLAYLHTEGEIMHLIEAFAEMKSSLLQNSETASQPAQLVLIGRPGDKKSAFKIMKRAALNASIYLCLDLQAENMPLYIGAANALVMPHFALNRAGMPEVGMLFYSYERLVIVPDLPRWHEMLPAQASILYEPANKAALVEALRKAFASEYQHSEEEAAALQVEASWQEYSHGLIEIYQSLLKRNSRVVNAFKKDARGAHR